MANTNEQLILITDVAVGKFQEMLFDADKKDSYLKISIALEGTEMHYAIDIKDELEEGDKVYNFGDLKVLVNEEDELLLKGLEIDYVQDEFGSEFTLHNPNMIEMYDEEDGGIEHRLGDQPRIPQKGAALRAQCPGPGVGPDEVTSLPEAADVDRQWRTPTHRVQLAELDNADTHLRPVSPERLSVRPGHPRGLAHTSSL